MKGFVEVRDKLTLVGISRPLSKERFRRDVPNGAGRESMGWGRRNMGLANE